MGLSDMFYQKRTDSRLADIALNVKNFGAKGDDITDNTDVIQAAIDAASNAGGGTVFVPAGTYKISDTLVVPKRVYLVGVGRGSVLKQYTNAVPIVHLTGETDAFRCGVKNLELRFNAAQTNANGNGIQLGEDGIMCYESEIENVYIDQAYNGIVCKNLVGGFAWMNTFKHVKVYRSHHYAFNLVNPDSGACTTNTFINCYAMQDHGNVKATAGGFYIRNTTDCTMIGCAVDDLTEGRALYVMSSNLTTMGLHVENCNMKSTGTGNLAMFTVSGSNVRMLGTRMEGMEVDKPNGGECYTFDVNSGAKLRILGMTEASSSVTSGDHFSVVPDGDTTEVYIDEWSGMFGSVYDPAPYKIKTLNGDMRSYKSNGKLRTFASAMPTSGDWTAGDYVEKTVPAIAGSASSRYVINGWRRITTGSGHVAGTDWVECRELTGT